MTAGELVRKTKMVAGVPELVAFALLPARRRHPHPAYRRLRQLEPVYRSPFGVWLVSSHDAVTAVIRNPAFGSDERRADLDALRETPLNRLLSRLEKRGTRNEGPFTDMFSQVMLFRDPPDHTRLRGLVSKAFTPKRAEALAGRVTELVEEHLSAVDSRGHMDLMADFAYPLPARVICELFGVPPADQQLIVDQAPALAAGLDPSPMRNPEVLDAVDRAVALLNEYLTELIERRRTDPGDDLLSALIAAEEAGDRLSHDELVSTAMLVLIAGHETTANLIGNGVLALLRDGTAADRLRVDPSVERSAIEELLRFDGPIQMMERIALEDVDVAGTRIPAGSIVILLAAAANRDPAVFTDPDRLDLQRAPNPHVGFGGGIHFCIGAALARVEARIAIPALLRRYPGLRLATERPDWRPSFTIRGLRSLPLTW
jgi:pimeloyl-[acyl-carrier protein] synthase